MKKLKIQEEPLSRITKRPYSGPWANSTKLKLKKHHLVGTVFSLDETIISLACADETSEGMKVVFSMQVIEHALDTCVDLPETEPAIFTDYSGMVEQ